MLLSHFHTASEKKFPKYLLEKKLAKPVGSLFVLRA